MKMKMKRILAMIMSIMMLVSNLPVTALAENSSAASGNLIVTKSTSGGTTGATVTPGFTFDLVVGKAKDYVFYGYSYNDLVGALTQIEGLEASATQQEIVVNVNNDIYKYALTVEATKEINNASIYPSNLYDISTGEVFGGQQMMINAVNGTSSGEGEEGGEENTTYTVSFNGNGGEGSMSAVTTDNTEYALPENAFTRDGYEFVGWATSAEGEVLTGSITLTGDVTLYAIWEETQTSDEEEKTTNYTNGQEITMAVDETIYWTVYTTSDKNVEGNNIGIFTITKSEQGAAHPSIGGVYLYTYALKANATGTAEACNYWSALTGDTSAGTRYIKITVTDKPAVTYNVTFSAGEGTGEMAAVTAPESYQLPTCNFTAPEGYEFAGWDVNGTVYAAGDTATISGDTTITATWKVLPAEVKVVFANLQGNTAEAVNTRASYSINVPVGLTCDGYTFLGWSETEVADLGKSEAVSSYINSNYTVSESATGEVTLYAVWQENPDDVSVTFDLNGGNGTVNAIDTKEGQTITLPSVSGLSKDGLVLVGWSTEPVADLALGAPAPAGVVAPGASYTMGFDGEVVSAFYAVWQKEPEREYLVKDKTYYVLQGKSITLWYYGDNNTWQDLSDVYSITNDGPATNEGHPNNNGMN